MELREEYVELKEKIKKYTELFGVIKPKVKVNRIFEDYEQIKEASSSLLEELLNKQLPDKDRNFLESIRYGIERDFYSLKQMNALLRVYLYHHQKHKNKSENALSRMEKDRKGVMAQNREEGLGKLFRSSYEQKQKRPFKKTAYEKRVERKKEIERRKKENQAIEGFLLESDDYKRSKRKAREARKILEENIQKLDQRERKVIEMYYGLNGKEKHTHYEIGQMLGGSSQQTISNIKKKALGKLRENN